MIVRIRAHTLMKERYGRNWFEMIDRKEGGKERRENMIEMITYYGVLRSKVQNEEGASPSEQRAPPKEQVQFASSLWNNVIQFNYPDTDIVVRHTRRT